MEDKSRIHNQGKMRQLIDFKNIDIDGYIYPTDIDGLIEYKNSEYIIFEIKFKGADVPYGQRLALQRMVDDFAAAGKRAIVFVCEHNVKDTTVPVVAARCVVREIYSSTDHAWITPVPGMRVREAVELFHQSAAS